MPSDRSSPPELSELLTVDEAAVRLGVHYMTMYRYLRQGRVAAQRVGGRWLVEAGSLDTLLPLAAARPVKRARVGRDDARRRLLRRVSEGDVAGAWAILETAFRAGQAPVDLYVELLGPVLRQVGDEWEAGERSVESEHRVTAVALRLAGRIEARGYRAGRRRRASVVLGAAPGDFHQLPSIMVADVLRWEGFDVVDLGANVPEEAFLEATAAARDLVAVGISLSTDHHSRAASRVIRRLRRAAAPALLLAGGPALNDEDEARTLGADGWAPHAGAVADVIAAGQ